MDKLVNVKDILKLGELMSNKDRDKKTNVLVWVLAIIGAVAAVAGIAYAVYRYLTPDYLVDFDEDFDDDPEDDEIDDDFYEESLEDE